jgi:hypothetical protein
MVMVITQWAEERGDDMQRHLDALADWTGPASETAKPPAARKA